MNNTVRLLALPILFIISSKAFASTQFTSVDISSAVNVDLQGYTYGENYPLGDYVLNVNGVPFTLARYNNSSGTTGIVQGGGSDYIGSFHYTFLVPEETQATVLYTLLNTAYGGYGVDVGQIIVTSSEGETATLQLTAGHNIRDHNHNAFVNELSLLHTTVVPTYFLDRAPTTQSIQSRLDRQELLLPKTFEGDTITSITFEGTGHGAPDGAAFLAGLTLGNESHEIPELEVILANTNIVLTWPVTTYSYELQSKTSLTQETWSTVFPAPTIVSNLNVVTNGISTTQRFFRLDE